MGRGVGDADPLCFTFSLNSEGRGGRGRADVPRGALTAALRAKASHARGCASGSVPGPRPAQTGGSEAGRESERRVSALRALHVTSWALCHPRGVQRVGVALHPDLVFSQL